MSDQSHTINLTEALEKSLKVGEIDTDKFAAVIELAKSYALQIDRVPADAGQDRTKALYLGPHLLTILKEIGLTPGAAEELEKVKAEIKIIKSGGKNTPAPDSSPAKSDDLSAIRRRRGA